MKWLSGLRRESRGASGIEYGLAIALIVMIALGALETTGNSVSNMIDVVGGKVATIKSTVIDGAYDGGDGEEPQVPPNIPEFLTFTNVDNASFSTPYSSEAVTVPSEASGKTASVSGDGSAELIINGTRVGTSVSLLGGESLALTMTSGSGYNSRKAATVTVGDESKTWNVNTLNAQVYSYSGSSQSLIVPDGVTSITVKAWGAGGSGGGINDAIKGGAGGAGAFVTGLIPTTPGSTLTIVVGEGGHAPTGARYTAFGGGGASGTIFAGQNSRGGGGGGATYVLDGSTVLAAAGGGGGGGGGYQSNIGGAGGAAGLSSGSDGGYILTFSDRIGHGGTQIAGGVAGISAAPAGNGDLLSGGTPVDSHGRAGGGSGYYGGGGSDYYSGAGGGSSYIVGGFSSGSAAGTGISPGGTSNADYPGLGVGHGGDTNTNGGNGYLMLIWAGATEFTGGATGGGSGGTGGDEDPPPADVEFMSFNNVADAVISSGYESNSVTVPSSASGKTASLTGDASAYIVLDGTPSGRSVTLAGGEMLSIAMTSSDTPGNVVSATITVGVETDTWTVTTAIDTTPDTLAFVDAAGVDLDSIVTSNTVNISGFSGSLVLAATNGAELVIDGTPTGSSEATISAGHTLALRLMSSSDFSTAVQTTVTLGDTAATWMVMTRAGSGARAFSYMGMSQAFVIPSGVTEIAIKAWGAGGGAGWDSGIAHGGAGGFVYDTQISVSPGETLVVIVGGAGRRDVSPKGGSGGGLSGVFRAGGNTQANAITIAGGGGGGNYYGSGAAGGYGMAGGGTSGQSSAAASRPYAGYPGTESSGGALGVGGVAAYYGTAGSALQGGRGSGIAASPASVAGGFGGGGSNGTGSTWEGGGGGGGYFGGGGGGGGGNAGAGGGGSGKTSGVVIYNAAGVGRVPAGVAIGDEAYPGGNVGYGGVSGNDNAGNGYVVISW